MERQSAPSQHEEAIVPVRPGLGKASPAGGSAPAPRANSASQGRRRVPPSAIIAVAAVLLLAAAIGVFFVLPDIVEQRAARPAPVETGPLPAPQQAEPAAPALTEAQIAELTNEADALLAQLLTQQQALTSLSVASWGEQDWERYQALSRAGDDAYLDEAYQTAISTYGEALVLGESLLEQSQEITARALEAGQRALEAGNASLATQQFDLVLSVDESHEAALAGRRRAERMPEALASTRRGDELRQSDQLAAAADAYRHALEIDSEWAPARSSLESVERLMAERRYEAVMSEGYRALGEERYADADERFRAALAMRPQSAEARDGIVQAEQGMYLDQIALAEARALAFERRELWQQAVQQYQAALGTDDSLAFAKEGLERARARADLDIKLENLIENPNLLFRDAVLASAEALLEEARSVVGEETTEDGGNVRLAQQIGTLTNLITLASRPVRVVLRSDQMTQVTLFRVGVLGSFTAMEVQLRPGNYTAVGSRDGYRDVRRTFTVLPGRELDPISIICVEPI